MNVYEEFTLIDLLVLGIMQKGPIGLHELKETLQTFEGVPSLSDGTPADKTILSLIERGLLAVETQNGENLTLTATPEGIAVLKAMIATPVEEQSTYTDWLLLPVKVMFLDCLPIEEQINHLEAWKEACKRKKARLSKMQSERDFQVSQKDYTLWHEHIHMILISQIEWLRLLIRRAHNQMPSCITDKASKH